MTRVVQRKHPPLAAGGAGGAWGMARLVRDEQPKNTTPRASIHTLKALAVHFSDRELAEVGLVRLPDGNLADNRDGFWTDYPPTLKLYDPATCTVITHGLLDRLLLALVREHEATTLERRDRHREGACL